MTSVSVKTFVMKRLRAKLRLSVSWKSSLDKSSPGIQLSNAKVQMLLDNLQFFNEKMKFLMEKMQIVIEKLQMTTVIETLQIFCETWLGLQLIDW